ncbi:MAG: acyl-CoA reductase [Saprospiraceae bacterium]
MNIAERIALLHALGERLRARSDEYLVATVKRTALHNGWFTEESQWQAIDAIASQMLDAEKLRQWLSHYDWPSTVTPRKVGLVMAGNLPLVGFHDVLCVFAAGHHAVVKLSDKDPYLLPALWRILRNLDDRAAAYYSEVERLQQFDAVIATGSNNAARYFEAYFGKYPHIIRKNRHAVAVLDGKETPAELRALGRDIFDFFGLGCRNVAKLYLPKGYDFEPLLEALHEYRAIVNHTKYKNNFDYNYALYILNKVDFKANGCILLREEKALQSAIATLHYGYYEELDALATELYAKADEIQLVVSHAELPGWKTYPLGHAQQPALDDYADGVDTLRFLASII